MAVQQLVKGALPAAAGAIQAGKLVKETGRKNGKTHGIHQEVEQGAEAADGNSGREQEHGREPRAAFMAMDFK